MSKRLGDQDSRVVKAEFDVWLSRDMQFNNPPGQNLKTYPMYTLCRKIKYTRKMLGYLDQMEDKHYLMCQDNSNSGHACAILLDGIIRYVWRNDLLSEAEYGKVQDVRREKFGVFSKKHKRTVGEDYTE